MHIIDPKWTDLAAGYRAVRSLHARLETKFGRAVQAGRKREFRRELTGWQKKRRVFFALALIAPLSIITLCLTAFYFREAACIIVYWTLLVGIILVTLAVAGRNYIRESLNRPKPEHLKTLPVDLEQRWWAKLSPQGLAVVNTEDKVKEEFLTMLAQTLPEECLAFLAPTLLLFSPAGLWLFQVVPWSGTIVRQEGVWKQIQIVRDKLGRKQLQEQSHEPAPDEEWLQRKNELANILSERLLQLAWTGSLIQGGLVFTNPKAILDKPRIQGNKAAYGLAKAWAERICRAPGVDGITLEIQLEILDALYEPQGKRVDSAKDEAERLYLAAAEELHQSVAKMVNVTG
jgi:hypothetical protein